jgi:hypothetical protein
VIACHIAHCHSAAFVGLVVKPGMIFGEVRPEAQYLSIVNLNQTSWDLDGNGVVLSASRSCSG